MTTAVDVPLHRLSGADLRERVRARLAAARWPSNEVRIGPFRRGTGNTGEVTQYGTVR